MKYRLCLSPLNDSRFQFVVGHATSVPRGDYRAAQRSGRRLTSHSHTVKVPRYHYLKPMRNRGHVAARELAGWRTRKMNLRTSFPLSKLDASNTSVKILICFRRSGRHRWPSKLYLCLPPELCRGRSSRPFRTTMFDTTSPCPAQNAPLPIR